MAKVDPEQLEKEADELMAKLNAETETPSEPETETVEKEQATEEVEHTEETEEVEAQDIEPLNPDVPEDTETVKASEEVQDTEEVKDEPSEESSPDDSVFEERYKNAQARMTKATQEASDLRKKISEMEERLNFREQLNSLSDGLIRFSHPKWPNQKTRPLRSPDAPTTSTNSKFSDLQRVQAE